MIIPIITPTYHRYEKYCDTLIDLMDKLWRKHPIIWLITDSGRKIKYPYKICINSGSWVFRLCEGIKYLKKIYSDLEYLYLIIEDLYPLWNCDENFIKKIEQKTIENKINYVAFLTYELEQNTVKCEEPLFYKISYDFPYYSQIQPALWRYTHLLETCEYALKNNIHDCWGFEHIHLEVEHYFSNYRWPSILDGFLRVNKVNPCVLKFIKLPEGKKLKMILLRDYLLYLPFFIYYSFKSFLRTFFKNFIF